MPCARLRLAQSGPLDGNSHAVALDGNGYIDFGRHDEFSMKNDFTVEAWLWIDKPRESSYAISALGRVGAGNIGWGLVAGRGRLNATKDASAPIALYFIVQQSGRMYVPLSKGESIENRWLHTVVVFDRANTAHFYLNGKHQGSVREGKPAVIGPIWLSIGCAEVTDADFWRGRLAHVAVYPRASSAQQIENHYRQRNNGGKEVAGEYAE